MSILIKGMEMPSGCRDCGFNYDCECTLLLDGLDETAGENRRPNCPLIEVPPHGRLIDADAMEKEVCGGCKHGEHKYENCIDCALANAPTIIESEGDE